MTRDELLARLRDPEDGFVERKLDGVKPADIRKTIVAFANSVPDGREAVLFIGVADDGQIVGCANADARQKSVRQLAQKDCYPPIDTYGEVLSTAKGNVVCVIVGVSTNRPHFSGPAYIRRGSESTAASPQLFDELIYSRNSLVAALLRLKDSVVSVHSIRHKLGSTKPMASIDYREQAECMILGCDAHTLRMQNISTKEYYSEPLANVQLSRDENKHRPLVIVKE